MAIGNRHTLSQSGFSSDGTRYVIRDVNLMDAADADLWNDTLNIQIDHRGRAKGGFLQPDMTKYSDGAGSEGPRCFYVRDEKTGRFWSAPYDPVQVKPREFEFSAGLNDIQWRNLTDGIEIALRLVIPCEDNLELWTATVSNRSKARRSISLYSYMPMGRLGLLVDKSYFDQKLGGIYQDYFPYYVKIPDYYKLAKLSNMAFCVPDRKPVSYEIRISDFVGGKTLANPRQLAQPKLGKANGDALIWSPAAAIYQWLIDLPPGKSWTVNLAFGPARNKAQMLLLKRKYLRPGGIDKAIAKVTAFNDLQAPSVQIETPDLELNHYVNHWLPRRAVICARTLRFNNCPQGRNVIQDAMGAAYVAPQTSRELFLRIWVHQKADGWMPHGMPMAEGVSLMPIGLIPHRDINSWGPSAVRFYMAETGDFSVLDEVIAFVDEPAGATLYEHINRGLEWLLTDRTERKLSRLGEGDWNDPLNMAGCGDKGESVWLTEALAAALDEWAVVADWKGDTGRAIRYREEADICRRAINDLAWDGNWYARGTTDAGRWFGTRKDKEGKLFLNAQSWAIISGAATGSRVDQIIKSVEKHLMTPCGPMKLAPAFQGMREDIGKITQKCPGTGENGSVYSHAATFYAYALFKARKTEKAFEILRTLLPGHGKNTPERCGQLPIYIPNFYTGSPLGSKAGQSSHSPNTGTAAWYYRTLIGMVLGVRGEFDGLRIDPQLPKAWKDARVWRKFRGADFDIHIRKDTSVHSVIVELDGQQLADNLVPLQRGGRHSVNVFIPQ